jgi:hypothetical protein
MRRNCGRFDKQGLLWGHGPEGPHGRIVAKWAYEATEGASRLPKPIPGKVTLAVPFCAQAANDPRLEEERTLAESSSPRVAAQWWHHPAPGQARILADLLREIAGGDPFHPMTADPAWPTPTVKQLAEAIYGERAFDRLPILADALEDAGCDNADILNHCRQPGEHARGCWVVDLLLGKK